MPAELSARTIAALPSRRSPYWVAPNLYVNKAKAPGFWLMLYASPVRGRRVEMGLGSIDLVPLRQVKTEVLEYRLQIARGRCPLTERQAVQDARKMVGHRPRERGPHSFVEAAEAFIAAHRPSWSNPKHALQWESSLATYAYPTIGHLPVSRIGVDEVLQVLEPIWVEKTETASRVRGRIESVIDYARSRKWIVGGDNPARWRGHLENLLPKKSKVSPVKHQAAMDWRALPRFYQALSRDRGAGALALRYVIVNALRSGEGRLTVVGEIDRERRLHSIPGVRTKTRTELRVPLSDEALRILDEAEQRRSCEFLFSGRRVGKPLSSMAMLEVLRTKVGASAVVHGFRSSFRDWAAEHGVDREISEMILGHSLGPVEGAYWRSDVIERRRVVLNAWAAFLTTPATAAEVVDFEEGVRRAG